jgi:hypothetical protein
MLRNVAGLLREGASAFRSYARTGRIAPSDSLSRTLYEARGIVSGWGHYYSFCNETNILSQLDREIDRLLAEYFGTYRDVIKQIDPKSRRLLIGVPLLEEFASHPFLWKKPKPPDAPLLPSQSTTAPIASPVLTRKGAEFDGPSGLPSAS